MRNIMHIAKTEVRALFANAVSVIVTVGLVVLPSLFAWYNVIACWDVFDNTGNLTVAVASVDEGYESDLVPLRVNIGEQVMSALRANDQIDWVFTSEQDAVDGARAGRYYAAVVIPQSFSRDMLTFYRDDAERADIVYYSNEKKSAIAPKITDQGTDTVSYQVNKVFAETISDISLGVAKSLSSYADEADAQGRIGEMAAHMRALADDAESAQAVLSLYASLAASAQDLAESSARLADTAQSQLAEATDAVRAGAQDAASLEDALARSADDTSRALGEASGAFARAADDVDGLFAGVSEEAGDAAAQMRERADAASDEAQRCRETAAVLEEAGEQLPAESADMLAAVVQQLRDTADAMDDSAAALRAAADKVDAGALDVQAEQQAAKDFLAQASASAASLQAEFDTVLRPELQSLAANVAQLAQGAGDAVDGLALAGDGLSDAAGSASGALAQAQGAVEGAAAKLGGAADKLRALADSLDGALAGGNTDELRAVLGSDVQALSSALAAPVSIERAAVFPAENFGSAMAPLYTTLALFIGSLLILVALRPASAARVREQLESPRRHELFLGHFCVMALLSLAQSTVMGLGNLLFLQVQAEHPLLLMVCFWFAGLVFTFLIYALVATFANLGKAMAVLLLIVQVTGCGGSFPLQILPGFVQAVSPFLPATHVVAAMRAAMFGTWGGDFWLNLGVLALFVVPAAFLGLVLARPLERFMAWYVAQVESSKVVG